MLDIPIKPIFSVAEAGIEKNATMSQGPRTGLRATVAQPDAFSLLQKPHDIRNEVMADTSRIGAEIGLPGTLNSGTVKNVVPHEQRLPKADAAVVRLSRQPGFLK